MNTTRFFPFVTLFAGSALAAVVSCGGSSSSTQDASSGTGAGGGAQASGTGGASALVGGGPSFSKGGGTTVLPTTEEKIPEVFVHTSAWLYRIELGDTMVMTEVGVFDGCGSITDIALDKGSQMYAVSDSSVYAVDKATGKCRLLANGFGYPNSLSFVPKGTLDPNEEALVGYNFDSYVRINTKTGELTTIGKLNAPFSSSGDIVSVDKGGTYLTVHSSDCSLGGCMDTLIEVDPVTGAMKKQIGPVNHTNVYGLAFWAGLAYGFDDGGNLFQVDVTNGATKTVPFVGMGTQSFWGAGSTTSAPPKAVIK